VFYSATPANFKRTVTFPPPHSLRKPAAAAVGIVDFSAMAAPYAPFREYWVSPGRPGAEQTRAPGIPSRHVVAAGARAVHGDAVDTMAPYLLRGDPLADDVVAAFEGVSPADAMEVVSRALKGGVAPRHAPAALRTYLDALHDVPSWVDWKAINRGGDVMARSGIFGLFVLMCGSLPLAYSSPAGVKPLVATGDLRGMAQRRLFETLRFVHETCKPDALRPGGAAWLITARVRLIHAAIRQRLARASTWRAAEWGLPINQFDMAGTNLAFSVSFLECMRRFGFTYSADDAAAHMALWRYSGHLIGLDADLAVVTEEAGRRRSSVIMATQEPPDDDCRALVSSLVCVPFLPWAKETNGAMRALYYTVSRAFVGDYYADAFGYPGYPVVPVLATYGAMAKVNDSVRRVSSRGERAAVLAGRQTWATILNIGLGGKGAEFHIPMRGGGVRRASMAPPSR